jgi:hypothetical protein
MPLVRTLLVGAEIRIEEIPLLGISYVPKKTCDLKPLDKSSEKSDEM